MKTKVMFSFMLLIVSPPPEFSGKDGSPKNLLRIPGGFNVMQDLPNMLEDLDIEDWPENP